LLVRLIAFAAAQEGFRQFPKVPGGGGEEEFVICATWAAQSEPSHPEDAFEVGKEHLDLFAQLHRDVVLAGLGNVAGNLAGVFMFFAGDLARVRVRAAPGLRWAGLADLLQGAITRSALAGWSLGSGLSSCAGTA